MFSATSRYASAETVTVGGTTAAIRLPIRERPPVAATQPRAGSERLDQIAARQLADATAFWRLCDASDALAPDALAARDQVEVPGG
jgi:hypothetical protein